MSLKTLIRPTCLCLLIGFTVAAVAQSPFVGTWKLDPAKSQLTGDTMKFSQGENGAMALTAGGHTNNFKTDGQNYPTWDGTDSTWKQVDDHTWQSSYKRNGMELAVSTFTLSPDGKMLTEEDKGTRPDGSAFDDVAKYERVGEGSGLMGTWRSTQTKLSESRTFMIQPNGNDGLTWTLPELKASVAMKFDGKDYPAEGPTVPPGFTLALTRTGPNSLKMVQKLKGEPVWSGEYTVAGDGKTMTDTGSASNVNEPTTEVWEKQ